MPANQNSDKVAAAPTRAETSIVESALYSLNFSAFRANDHLRHWFVPAFNDWYAPLATRGVSLSFSTVFDLGMLLVKPGSPFGNLPDALSGVASRYRLYCDFLQTLEAHPMMQRARIIWEAARESPRPGTQSEVGWLLIRAFSSNLHSGCLKVSDFEAMAGGEQKWGDKQREHIQSCPRCMQAETARNAPTANWRELLEDRAGFQQRIPLLRARSDGRVEVKGRSGQPAIELAIPPYDPSRPYPAFWLPSEPTQIPDRVRLFVSRVAVGTRGAEDVIDGQVVQACLDSPNLGIDQYQPPKIVTTIVEARKKSKLPGQVAGITRIETMTERDSWLDIVPSELALGVRDEDALLQKLLLEKPLVFRHERDEDMVPKHRASICFLVEAPSAPDGFRNDLAEAKSYVYAKREAFDLIRNLREAIEQLPERHQVDFEIAVFVLHSFHEDAVVHRQFNIRQLQPRLQADESINRFDQMVRFASLVPSYFVHHGVHMETTNDAAYEIVDPRLQSFLKRRNRMSLPFHAEYVVAIGSIERLLGFLPARSQDAKADGNLRQGVLLIAPNTEILDAQVSELGEPSWMCGRGRNLQDAARILARELPEKSLPEIQQEFLEMVIGKSEEALRLHKWLRIRGTSRVDGKSRAGDVARDTKATPDRSSSRKRR